jgi:zinc D-Ala-D-Ala dipeptidase
MLSLVNQPPDESTLAPVTGVRCAMQYSLQELRGAMHWAFLDRRALAALKMAQADLAHRNPGAELLLWDAYRTRATQQAIFDRHLDELRIDRPDLGDVELRALARRFVSDPTSVFPHGTGGAVDVTILHDGRPVPMGTGFDEFSERAARNHFRAHPPEAPADRVARDWRELLRAIMEHADFVGLENEWWHYEYGTERWGAEQRRDPFLTHCFEPPAPEGPATEPPTVPRRLPALEMGVAQPFLTSAHRAASLDRRRPGHYYVRDSHPTVHALADFLTNEITGGAGCQLTQSGIAACLLALDAVTPEGGTVAYDRGIYYEVETALSATAANHGWKLHELDLVADPDVLQRLLDAGAVVDTVYLDTPRNWLLDCSDLPRLRHLADAHGAILIADTSVQPVHDAIAMGAHVTVASLSKDLSLGLTPGGLVACATEELLDQVHRRATAVGHVLAPEAAHTVYQHARTARDRLAALADKLDDVVAFLDGEPAVRAVRFANPGMVGGLPGSQLAFHLDDPGHGLALEALVGQNSLDPSTTLTLACTFGAPVTTIEHFASNARSRDVGASQAGEEKLPDDLVRIGLGYEPASRIVADLGFVLATAPELAADATRLTRRPSLSRDLVSQAPLHRQAVA